MADVNQRENIAGAGINIAQRVMDCGDAGHILARKRVADDLAQYRRWQPLPARSRRLEVKHGVVVSIVNLYADVVGNPAPPPETQNGEAYHTAGSSIFGGNEALASSRADAGNRRHAFRDRGARDLLRAGNPEAGSDARESGSYCKRFALSLAFFHSGEKHRGASVRESEPRQG